MMDGHRHPGQAKPGQGNIGKVVTVVPGAHINTYHFTGQIIYMSQEGLVHLKPIDG